MGYPMTWRRLLNRNHLTDGDYNTVPVGWHRMKSVINADYRNDVVTLQAVIASNDDGIDQMARRLMLFAGDLRRLERDMVDEDAICMRIARRTGLDANDVAAVLKEFVAQ